MINRSYTFIEAKLMRLLLLTTATLALFGCASLTNDAFVPMSVSLAMAVVASVN